MDRAVATLLGMALAWIAALTQWGVPLAVDEVEFFRATKWVGEGLVPFRDFWEHHLPLQWIVFAPVAALFANGPGTEAIVILRWAQMSMWAALFILLLRLVRQAGLDPAMALLLLLVSPSFVSRAVEYRLDVPGNLAFVAAVALIAFRTSAWRWVVFGVLMSAAVLANIRLAPLVIVTAVLSVIWRSEERRWGWNGRALWMICGVAPVAASFTGWLVATNAWPAFVEGIHRYNTTSARLLEVDTLVDALLVPVWTLDLAAIAYWMAGIAGVVIALRTIRTPGFLQFMAILSVASVATIAAMEVQYDYHFQNVYLLMLPLVALAIGRFRRPAWRALVPIVATGALVIAWIQTLPAFGQRMAYQDAVMTSVDRLTRPGDRVLDGAGYALRRRPAYRFWFLTTGVRMMAAQRLIDPYGVDDIRREPPEAIIYDYRLALYLQIFPEVADYLTHHYVPVYRHLWVPGMATMVEPGERMTWIAPRAGTYESVMSEALASHPLFTKPLEYAAIEGPLSVRYAIPLRRLPLAPLKDFLWIVDGVPQVVGKRRFVLRKGSRVVIRSTSSKKTGVLLVPQDVGTLCLSTTEEGVF